MENLSCGEMKMQHCGAPERECTVFLDINRNQGVGAAEIGEVRWTFAPVGIAFTPENFACSHVG